MVNSKNSDKIMDLEIKKSDIRREKARILLDKSIWLYFLFTLTGMVGFVFGYVESQLLNYLIIASFVVLLLGAWPYIKTINQEEKNIDSFIAQLKK